MFLACGFAGAAENEFEKCPHCGGSLTKVGLVKDDESKPSKNISVWNRSICGNVLIGADSPICTQCWLAYSKLLKRWERSIESRNAFRKPLAEAIQNVPLPSKKDIASLVVYSQSITGTNVMESVSFWCSDRSEVIAGLQSYADTNKLKITIRRSNADNASVIIGTKP